MNRCTGMGGPRCGCDACEAELLAHEAAQSQYTEGYDAGHAAGFAEGVETAAKAIAPSRPDEDKLRCIANDRIRPRESEESIETWANATFGPPISNVSVAARAFVEFAELLDKLTSNKDIELGVLVSILKSSSRLLQKYAADATDTRHPGAAEELADVEIVFARLWRGLGADRQVEIDKKMAINRQRKWTLDGNGHGQHVKETP